MFSFLVLQRSHSGKSRDRTGGPSAGASNRTVSCCVSSLPGAYFWLLFLPAWVLFLILQVNLADPSLANFPPALPTLGALWDVQALLFVVLWILFQALLYVLPVGKVSEERWWEGLLPGGKLSCWPRPFSLKPHCCSLIGCNS